MAYQASESWWEGPHPQDGWTEYCATQMHAPVPIDDVTAGEARIIQRRADILATLIGLQQAASNYAIRVAEVL